MRVFVILSYCPSFDIIDAHIIYGNYDFFLFFVSIFNRDVMKGYESTVFAYGQTGTGKTHTMEGDILDPDMKGLIPRSSQAIFDTLEQPHYLESKITCSYLEIYNEELSDLLVDHLMENKPKLDIMESKTGTICRGLTQKEVKTPDDVLELMKTAQNQKRIEETKMNKQSSRSHCVFTIRVNGKFQENEGIIEFDGKLHLVDLAGSECAKTAGLDSSSEVSLVCFQTCTILIYL